MHTDIYKDHMYPVELFGKNALYTEGTIPREEVPGGWHCYDLCGTDQKPDKPLILTDLAVVYRTGTVLSPAPLMRNTTLERRVEYVTEARQGIRSTQWELDALFYVGKEAT